MISSRCLSCSRGSVFTLSVILCVMVVLLYSIYHIVELTSKPVRDFMEKYKDTTDLIRENGTTYFITVRHYRHCCVTITMISFIAKFLNHTNILSSR